MIFNSTVHTGANASFLGVNGVVTINGQTFTGKNISIRDGVITIDGKVVDPNADQVTTDADGNKVVTKWRVTPITINGDVGKVQVTSGTINITGNVTGDVNTTSGDIDVKGNVDGSVRTVSGNVTTGAIKGDAITTSGDIAHAFNGRRF